MSEVAKVGDKVKIIDSNTLGLTDTYNGKIVEVVGISNMGNPFFKDERGSPLYLFDPNTYEILERDD